MCGGGGWIGGEGSVWGGGGGGRVRGKGEGKVGGNIHHHFIGLLRMFTLKLELHEAHVPRANTNVK